MHLNARKVQIDDSTFVDVHGDYIQLRSASINGMQELARHVAAGALHNSDERCHSPRCHPGTRVAIQQYLMSWVTHGDPDAPQKRIKWIKGPAGTGKTAILQTIAERCRRRGILAASFFWSQSREQCTKMRLVPTLAYQLAQSIEDLRRPITAAVERDTLIFKANLDTQMDVLILQPIYQALYDGNTQLWPKAIVLDGLDECEGESDPEGNGEVDQDRQEHDHREVLDTLLKAAADPHFPFRIFIASRPERAIRKFFDDARDYSTTMTLDERYQPSLDIELLLRYKFAELRCKYSIQDSWPSESVIQTLVSNASGQFIYVTTISRFIDTPAHSPQEQIQKVLKLKVLAGHDNPFAQLDALYAGILNTSPKPISAVIWLRTIHYINSNWHCQGAERQFPAVFVNRFLQSVPGEAGRFLGNLHSLLCVPDAHDKTSPYSFYHRSFLDFLLDAQRSKELFITRDAWDGRFFLLRYLSVYRNPGTAAAHETKEFLDLLAHLRLPSFHFAETSMWTDSVRAALVEYDVDWWVDHQLAHGSQWNLIGVYHGIHETVRSMIIPIPIETQHPPI